MSSTLSGRLQEDLGALLESGSLTGFTDRDLLERLAGEPDAPTEAAFQALVMRHGPMVLRVCRNLLVDPADADDAFQATFLLLVKKRSSIRNRDSVVSWLYGVATRVAVRARVEAARRRKHERGKIRLAASFDNATESAEHGSVVQEEVRRLPEKYRSVVLLCYWEGLTQEQAALQLGSPIGTVRSRIARARDILRKRLIRRGLASGTPAVAFLSGPTGTSAALPTVPRSLIRSSLEAATRVASGVATAEVVSAQIASLFRHGLWSMMMIKIKHAAVFIALAGLFGLGASLWAQQSGKERSRPPVVGGAPSRIAIRKTSPRVDIADLAHVVEPPDLLVVEVLEALPGRPISGERLVRPDGKISLGFYGEVHVAGLTLPEVKEKIILHLQKFLTDETLGLIVEGALPDDSVKHRKVAPLDSDRVFVDVTQYNSRFFYVVGDLAAPGRMPYTGGTTVLDAINLAGGLLPTADQPKIRVMRSFPKGSPVETFKVDYAEISMGTDQSTNYVILPNDRVVVPRALTKAEEHSAPAPGPSTVQPQGASPDSNDFDRTPRAANAVTKDDLRALEKRLVEMEQKLDDILMRLPRQER